MVSFVSSIRTIGFTTFLVKGRAFLLLPTLKEKIRTLEVD